MLRKVFYAVSYASRIEQIKCYQFNWILAIVSAFPNIDWSQ